MALSPELVSKLVKVTNDRGGGNKDYTIYGTIVADGDRNYVRIDGSELSTPFESTVDVKKGDRVIVEVKNHTATITGNVTSPAARTDDVQDLNDKVVEFEKVTTETLVANNAIIENLKTTKLDADTAKITYATIEGLEASNAAIDVLAANKANVADLTAINADIADLKAGKANITDLNATNATVGNLSADVADIDTLIFGTASGTSIQTSFSNAVIAQLGDAQIKSAMIASLAADKISAGSINTNNVTIGSEDGSMVISDETIQITEKNGIGYAYVDPETNMCMEIYPSTEGYEGSYEDPIEVPIIDSAYVGKYYIGGAWFEDSEGTKPWATSKLAQVVRVQIGKDASNDYSINIWDEQGNLMFSKGGITDSAIKDAIIRNDMVSDTANISASKLDINSLFTEINSDTKNTIKATQIHIDDKNQTLDVAFKEMSTEVTELGENVSSQGTALSVVQGQISSKVWQQDIETAIEPVETLATDANNTAERASNLAWSLRTSYSELEQTMDGISSTVGTHTSTLVNMGYPNLYTGTADFSGDKWKNLGFVVPDEVDSYGNAITDCTAIEGTLGPYQEISAKSGDVFTLSCTAYTYEEGSTYAAEVVYFKAIERPVDGAAVAYIVGEYESLGPEPKRLSATYTVENDCVLSFGLCSANTNTDESIRTSSYRLEKGDVANDWAPDHPLVDRVTVAETKITQTSEEIELRAYKTDVDNLAGRVSINEASISVMPDQIKSSVKETYIDPISEDVSDLESRVTTAESTITQLPDKIESSVKETYIDPLEGRMDTAESNITQLPNQIKSSVKETYIDPISEDISDLESRIGTAESSITQTAEQIELRVTKTETSMTENLNDHIGGVNLYSGTADFSGDKWKNIVGWDAVNEVDEYGNVVVHGKYANSSGPHQEIPAKKGDVFTLSLTAHTSAGLNTIQLQAREIVDGSIKANSTIGDIEIVPIDPVRIYRTYTVKNDCTFAFVPSYTRNEPDDYLYISSLKLEKGSRATDWTPAPGDNADDVADLKSRVTVAETSITQNAEQIELRAKKSELDTLAGRVSNAETSITQNAEQIELRATKEEVNNLSGKVTVAETSITQNAKDIALKASKSDLDALGNRVTTAETSITQNATAISLKASQSDLDAVEVTVASHGVDITGLTTFKTKAGNGSSTVIHGESIKTGTITADQIAANTITSAEIAAGAITADNIALYGLMTVYEDDSLDTDGGYIGYDSGFNSSTGIGIRASDDNAQVVCTDQAARLSHAGNSSFVASADNATIVGKNAIIFKIDSGSYINIQKYGSRWNLGTYSSKTVDIGNSDAPFASIWLSSADAVYSDRNKKNSIEELPEKYVKLFDLLRPVRYKLNNGTSDRYHVGYIAQDVEEAMLAAGIDSQEFGGLIKDVDAEGNDVYFLRYGEFDGIYAAKIKQLEARNAELEARIEKLEKLLTQTT